MKLARGYIYATIKESTQTEWSIVEYLNNFSNTNYVRGRPRVARYSLFNPITKTFPAGIIADVTNEVERETQNKVEILDLRQRAIIVPAKMPTYLRPYQASAVLACLEYTNGIVKMPTGAGKTEVFVALTQIVAEPWLLLVHRATLAHQAAWRVEERTGETVGLATEGKLPLNRRIVCATYQTLSGALNGSNADTAQTLLRRTRGVVCDEAHTVPARTFLGILTRLENAYFRIGLSATPFGRSDRRNKIIVGFLGPTIYQVTAKDLAEHGRLLLPTVRVVDVHHRPVVTARDWNRGREYQRVYRRAVVESEVRNAYVIAAVKLALKPCLLFVKHVRHARMLASLLRQLGFSVDVAIGATAISRREEIIDALDSGRTEVCVTTPVFQEGVDIPRLMSIVVAAADKSTIAVMQRAGRTMRIAEGKEQCEIWDFRDIGVPWLSKHAERRLRQYENAQYRIVDETQNESFRLALSDVLRLWTSA